MLRHFEKSLLLEKKFQAEGDTRVISILTWPPCMREQEELKAKKDPSL
jgi:hypothetical protein